VESVSVRLETVLTRLSAHFRGMPESKLLGRLPDGRSRAAAGHELAGRVALAAQGVEDRLAPVPPTWRRLPFEGLFVVGDQIGVTGHDLLVACAGAVAADAAGEVWAPGDGRRSERLGIADLLGKVLAAAEELAGRL
jgi:hypothetical protein